MERRAVARMAIAITLALPALAFTLAAEPDVADAQTTGSWEFAYTGAPVQFTVPAGVEALTAVVGGGPGGTPSSTGPAGAAGTVIGSFPVTADQVLTIWVGGNGGSDGGWGYGCGGGYGFGTFGDGGGGGGGSAVAVGTFTDASCAASLPGTGTALVVAGGGGGGGANWNSGTDAGGAGGDGGNPASAGVSGGNSGDGTGGCGGCRGVPGGAEGESLYVDFGAGGGGGGGGWVGGGGGGSGLWTGRLDIGGGGGGGGGALSYADARVSDVSFLPGSTAGNGSVTLTTGTVETFTCSDGPRPVTVPGGVDILRAHLEGGHGGTRGLDKGGPGAPGGTVDVKAPVTAGQTLWGHAGCYGGATGGLGYGQGGDHGEAPGPNDSTGYDGGGGGGGSEVSTCLSSCAFRELIAVAGGGGAGGGDGELGINHIDDAGGAGGAGGLPPQDGFDAPGRGGGDGGAADYWEQPQGRAGHDCDWDSGGGAGGGGGGGASGADGGLCGASYVWGGWGGGGGGGGHSAALLNAYDPQFGTSELTGDGVIVLSYASAAPAVIVPHGGAKQHVSIGEPYPAVLEALVTNDFGDPVPGVVVTFTLPTAGASATFDSGGTTETATTDAYGVASTGAFTADLTVGPWVAEAAVAGATTPARFGLENGRAPTGVVLEVRGDQPFTPSEAVDVVATVTSLDVAPVGVPTGSVRVVVGGRTFTGDLADGVATVALPAGVLTPDSTVIDGYYDGAPDFIPSSTSITVPVVPDPATLTVTSSQNPSVPSTWVTLTATVSVPSGVPLPTGCCVKFFVDGTFWTQPIDADGVSTLLWGPLPAGTYPAVAELEVAGYEAASASLVQVSEQVATATSLTSSRNPSDLGDPVTATASVRALTDVGVDPSGVVTFTVDGTVACAEVPLAAGSAICELGDLGLGTKVVEASYLGTPDFQPSAAVLDQGVLAVPTTTVVTSSANPSDFAQAVTLTAAVRATPPSTAVPTGTVSFVVDGVVRCADVALVDGRGSCDVGSGLGAGDHAVTAEYSGAPGFGSSTGQTTQQVLTDGTATSLLSSVNPSVYGTATVFTATVRTVPASATVPTGTVSFTVDGVVLCAPVALVAGTASCPAPTSLPAGASTVTATYDGSPDFAPSTARLTQQVLADATATSLTSSLEPSQYGDDVVFTATVRTVPASGRVPTGTVAFSADGVVLCEPVELVDGAASCPAPPSLPVGTYTVTATYSGADDFGPSAAELTQQVLAQPTATVASSSANPSSSWEPLELTATVTTAPAGVGEPTGGVVFRAANQECPGVPAGPGRWTCELPANTLTPGVQVITASYVPNSSNFSASATSFTQVVDRAVSITQVSTDPAGRSVFGEPLVLRATVAPAVAAAGQPDGFVQFEIDGIALGAPVALDATGGVSVPAALDAGAHTVAARYLGSDLFFPSGASTAHTITPAPTTTTVVATPEPSPLGGTVTLSATVTAPVPGFVAGTVAFTVDGASVSDPVPVIDGVATSPPLQGVPAGRHAIAAQFAPGRADHAASRGTGEHGVSSWTVTTVRPSLNPVVPGETVTFDALVQPPVPGGTVQFTADGAVLPGCEAVAVTNHRARCATATLPVGPHTITASYSGAPLFDPSSGSTVERVHPLPIGLRYVPVEPDRIVDTRVGLGGPTLGPAATARLRVTGTPAIPATGVGAVLVNATATNVTEDTYVTLWRAGAPQPHASNLNPTAGEVAFAQSVTVGMGDDGSIDVYNHAGRADVVLDVVGWFTETPDTTRLDGGAFVPLDPVRLLDTREQRPIGPGGELALPVLERGGVPARGATAVVLNVTATEPTAPGYLSVYPTGAPWPGTSTLNFAPDVTVANLAVAPVGPDGTVTIRNYAGTTHAVVDVLGYVTAPGQAPSGAGLFNPLVPLRRLDTRTYAEPVGPGGVIDLQVGGAGGVPPTATGVMMSLTVTEPTEDGYLTVFPGDEALPLASNVNFVAGQTVPNLVVADLGADGTISIFNYAGTTSVIVDVLGWFEP